MNIYFACSITGGRNDESIYQTIVDTLVAGGHNVPTAHLSNPDVVNFESVVEPQEVFTRDIRWIEECDALIAEVSTPSHGVGFEIAYALSINKPVLCLHHRDVRISKMITGNTNPNIKVLAYHNQEEIMTILCHFLDDRTQIKTKST